MTTKRKKYKIVIASATSVNGEAAGHAPSQVKIENTEINNQKIKRAKGEKLKPVNKRDLEPNENKNKNITARTNPTTPPSLLGIERRIA